MQAPMTKKFRKFIYNPKNAQVLTEKILTSGYEGFKITIDGKEVEVKQIGTKEAN